MSAHCTPHEARAIVQVLRRAADEGRGPLTPSDVEVLEGVLQANAKLMEALRELAAEIDDQVDVIDGRDGPVPNWAMELSLRHGPRVRAALSKAEVPHA